MNTMSIKNILGAEDQGGGKMVLLEIIPRVPQPYTELDLPRLKLGTHNRESRPEKL